MQRVFDVIRKVAPTDLTVLIRGPSGTGKELVANALHYNSPRRGRPLIKVNCAAFSRELVESELFGHERGAFTGAISAREGKFEIADGGTLLLDEIGDMPLETQAKILRVLQERELERVGGNRTIKVDVRILAATNQDLEAKVQNGSFREDLFYRLNVVPIAIPPLRERREDLPLLIEHFLAAVAARLRPAGADAGARRLPAAARSRLAGQRARARARDRAGDRARCRPRDPARRSARRTARRAAARRCRHAAADRRRRRTGFKESKQRVIERFERRFIVDALDPSPRQHLEGGRGDGHVPPAPAAQAGRVRHRRWCLPQIVTQGVTSMRLRFLLEGAAPSAPRRAGKMRISQAPVLSVAWILPTPAALVPTERRPPGLSRERVRRARATRWTQRTERTADPVLERHRRAEVGGAAGA